MEDEYYIVRNNQVLKGKLIKRSRRGTAYWFQINGANKKKLVAMDKMFESESEAEKFMRIRKENRLRARKKRAEELEKENKEIDEILLKLYIDFGCKCNLLQDHGLLEMLMSCMIELEDYICLIVLLEIT